MYSIRFHEMVSLRVWYLSNSSKGYEYSTVLLYHDWSLRLRTYALYIAFKEE